MFKVLKDFNFNGREMRAGQTIPDANSETRVQIFINPDEENVKRFIKDGFLSFDKAAFDAEVEKNEAGAKATKKGNKQSEGEK